MKSVLLASLLVLAAPAFAQNAPAPDPTAPTSPQTQRPHERFVDADTDHDGRLSRTEAQAMPFVSRHFDQIDSNHDGYVSRDELRAAREKMQAMRQQRAGQKTASDPETGGTN